MQRWDAFIESGVFGKSALHKLTIVYGLMGIRERSSGKSKQINNNVTNIR
jgi:hypothetical protein